MSGVSLDWERCRDCGGYGSHVYATRGESESYPCKTCGGHGSLKAAALAKANASRRKGSS